MPRGGRRKGSGRHKDPKRENTAHDFYGTMRWAELGTPRKPRTITRTEGGKTISYVDQDQPWKPPFREKFISLLAAYHGVSKKTIEHYIDDFNPAIHAEEERLRITQADPYYHPADLQWERIKYMAAWWPHTNTEILQIVAREFSDPEFVRVNSETRGGMSFDEMLWRRTRFLAGYS
jgi:hypothetical protein